jgi:hypothetical protein
MVGALSLIQKDGYSVAFFALTGICVVGLYSSYMSPIFLRLRNPDFVQGPWNLKRYSKIIGWISVAWVAFISILFVSPLFPQWRWWSSDEVNSADFTGPMILLSFVGVGLWWALRPRSGSRGRSVPGGMCGVG